MSESDSDFPYKIGLLDVDNGQIITNIGAEEQDLKAFGVMEELEEKVSEASNETYANVVYGPRYERFEQTLEETEISENVSEFEYEAFIDEILEKNPAHLKRFLPEELQTRMDNRAASLPPIRSENPEASQNALDAKVQAAREEASRYLEETEQDLVDYNEIKRNTAVVFAESYGDLSMIGKDMILSEFED